MKLLNEIRALIEQGFSDFADVVRDSCLYLEKKLSKVLKAIQHYIVEVFDNPMTVMFIVFGIILVMVLAGW